MFIDIIILRPSKLDLDVISMFIVTMVIENAGVSIRQIIKRIHLIYGYTVSSKKAWKGKHLAITMAFEDWKNSYSLLLRWMTVVQQFNPNSYFQFVNKECLRSSLNNNFIIMFY